MRRTLNANEIGRYHALDPVAFYATAQRAVLKSVRAPMLQEGASTEVQWLICHAVRYPAKKGDAVALKIRAAAKGR